jgi:hypothetical protein
VDELHPAAGGIEKPVRHLGDARLEVLKP